MTRRLIMFTAAYPYDRTNAWKGRELAAFGEYFDEIHVAPLHQREFSVSPDLPEGVHVLPPAFPMDRPRKTTTCRTVSLLGPRLLAHIGLMEPVMNGSDLRRYWAAAADIEEIMRSEVWRHALAPLLPGSLLYFFWGRGYAGLLPYLPARTQANSLVRLHRWDLYPEINRGYIPFQRRIVETAGIIAPISSDGVELLKTLYPVHAARIRCLRLGTVIPGMSRPSNDDIFRIISCAYARPVKRLHLIAEALSNVRFPVIWTHIGDGPELPRVRTLCTGLPANVEVNLVGNMVPEDVPRVYAGRPFDLFLNVSDSEGIPVSIMEAMAAGIPALATDVGGTAEIVDDSVGRLVPAQISAGFLAQAIANFRDIPAERRVAMREACRQRIERDYDQSRNARAVADALSAL